MTDRSTPGKRSSGPGSASRLEADLALIQRIVHKDKEAFEALYYAYHRRIYQFVLRLVRRAEIAEEVVNDVMFVVWERAEGFKGGSQVSTWLMGIAYRKGLKALERFKLRPLADVNVEEVLTEASLKNDVAGPESAIDNAKLLEHLGRGIEGLTPAHQSVVELTALGYSYTEISEIVGCPVNTVKTRMFHARRRLKQFLADAMSNPDIDLSGAPL